MNEPIPSLAESLDSESLTDFFSTIGDAALDVAISSRALDGVPIFGALTSLFRAQRDIRKSLFVRQVARFLFGLKRTTEEDRRRFTGRLRKEGKLEEFGEAILLILDRVNDTNKPTIIGRIMAAHIAGEIEYVKAMRLVSIVDRCYAEDLEYLRSFQPGLQGPWSEIAAMLQAAGLLAISGEDLGGFTEDEPGGSLYELTSYGRLFVKFGLSP